ncbi:ABC transporter permease [uncultured Jatrophihabitans sp.]|uniref:ABC transporter permease n=1 Tax=uncultured Jatrophihabitans sp. TaxID=1610747 RepID=UPI0035CBFC53
MSNSFVKAFTFIDHRHSLVINRMVSHLEVSAKAVAIAIVVGVPLGILLGHLHRFSFLAINVSNIGRALPSFGLLAILLPVVGIGELNIIIVLVVLAAPPILTNTYVAVDQVDADTVDAAKGIGLRPWQVVAKVELPPALPLIFAGIRTAAVFVIATATLGGVFGGGGLGDIISNEASYGLDGVIGASYVLIALAFLSQGLFLIVERLVTPEGMRQGIARRRRRIGKPGFVQTMRLQASASHEAQTFVTDNENSTEGDVDTSPQLEKGRST